MGTNSSSSSILPPFSKLAVLVWPLIFLSLSLSTASFKIPNLGLVGRRNYRSFYADESSLAKKGFKMYNYTQTLDHFNYRPESYTTFQQRYVMNSKYWGGPNTSSPIFVYTGDEGGLYTDVDAAGFLSDNAARYKSLLVYIEHRYYGTSVPFGSTDEAFRNASTLGYFSSEQALADYAQIIVELKKNFSAGNCPVIVTGGSYGGMLAAWFRLKYPHIAMGAVASSAPILYFDDIIPANAYLRRATQDYREISENCYKTIRQSWFEIDRIAAQSNGLALLTQRFNSCSPLDSAQELKDYLTVFFESSAQYNNPPKYPVNLVCNAIDEAPTETDIVGKIAAAVVAVEGHQPCHNITSTDTPKGQVDPWQWQTCTELVIPFGCGENDTMFQAMPFELKNYTDSCKNITGVVPRPHWATTEFGGHDINSVLKNFGSNIIFTNGLRDPYSVGGVLQNISDSIVAIHTIKGAHCLDMLPARPYDPDWLISQRKKVIQIVDRWLAEYRAQSLGRSNNQT